MVYKSVLLMVALAGMALADTGFTSTINITETDNSPKCQVGQIKVSTGTLTCNGQVATILTGGGGGTAGLPLPAGDTSYIQNNPATVQVATMSITGKAAFDNAVFDVYTATPTMSTQGQIKLAFDTTATLPCLWMYVNGARYHMCGCPDSGPATNSGQCAGLLCGVTYP